MLKFSTKIIQAGDAENTYAPRAPAKQRRNAIREKAAENFQTRRECRNFLAFWQSFPEISLELQKRCLSAHVSFCMI